MCRDILLYKYSIVNNTTNYNHVERHTHEIIFKGYVTHAHTHTRTHTHTH